MCVKKAPHGASHSPVKTRKARAIMPDGRRSAARRYRAIAAAFEDEIGGDLTPSELAAVETAATLQLRVEQLRADIVAGKPVDDDLLIRLASTSRRALSQIKPKAKPAGGNALQTYLDARAAAAEADDDDEDGGDGEEI
jgi:hypothetical protein